MDSMKGQLPNLYGILGLTIDVCKEPNCNELLKKAYLRKARLCHPDKYKGHEAAELFELLTGAYDILRDDKQRSQYNGRMNVIKESSNDFVRLRQQTTDYYSSMPEKKSTATVNIDKVSDTPLNKGESKRMITELEKNRAQQDIDLKHEKIFDGDRINMKKFHSAFDKVHKREDDSIVLHNGVPLAWDGLGTIANYSEFDDLNNLFVEDNTRMDTKKQNYAGVNFGTIPNVNLTKDDVSALSDAEYYDRHNDLGDDYFADMKNKLRKRDTDGNSYGKMEYNDFKKETAGYGIFDQLGLNYDDRLSIDDNEDSLTGRYNKLMAERAKK